jgi:sugar/nucleoside kinase (ribokinase family)
MTSEEPPTIVSLGAHILDVLAKYVEEIPPGQGGVLIEEIRLSPAGAAGGTAVTLAKLGARVVSAGAIGSDDAGHVLRRALERFGVDCSELKVRPDVQTSSTVLPIRPNGDRPALHVIGANATYTLEDLPRERIAQASFLHLGGPEFLGPDNARAILELCREHGVTTSVDLLADGWPELLEMLAPALPYADYLLPNREQARLLTGEDDVVDAARALLERGPRWVVATCGADGSVLVSGETVIRVPAYEVDVVDTTGCGDAFTAGFLRGLSLGRDEEGAAELGSACAALVAQGLGSDAGDFDLDEALRFAAQAQPRQPA